MKKSLDLVSARTDHRFVGGGEKSLVFFCNSVLLKWPTANPKRRIWTWAADRRMSSSFLFRLVDNSSSRIVLFIKLRDWISSISVTDFSWGFPSTEQLPQLFEQLLERRVQIMSNFGPKEVIYALNYYQYFASNLRCENITYVQASSLSLRRGFPEARKTSRTWHVMLSWNII